VQKTPSNPKINPKPDFFLSSDMFFRHFQDKKIIIHNLISPHHIEPFGTKTYYFGSKNHRNYIFFSKLEYDDSLSIFLPNKN